MMVRSRMSCFNLLQFERKCPTGLRGTPTNLDIPREGPGGEIGIESECWVP